MKICEERRKIKSVCNFIVLKNNKLNYECKECKKRSLKPINQLIKNFPNVYQFVMETLTNFFCCEEKVFIHTNTWIAGKDLMKHHYQIKKLFTVNCI